MKIINGKAIAQHIIERLKGQKTPMKILEAILVGEDQNSQSFLKQKEKIAKDLGIDFRIHKFDGDISSEDLRGEVSKIGILEEVGGVIVQLPLPEQIDKVKILNSIPKEKDVDVLGEQATDDFYNGRSVILPPAVETVKEILEIHNLQLKDMKVAVVGRGFLVGKPISKWLGGIPEGKQASYGARCKELFLLHRGNDLNILKEADLVITGTGQAGLIKSEMLEEGAFVIDFGYSAVKEQTANGEWINKIKGDFDVSEIGNLSYTPTPGGTGPILVAKLMENFYKINEKRISFE